MSRGTFVTHWIDWRELMGPPRSRQRRELERRLDTRPALLYYGDSWFSTPLYPNLARQSAGLIDGIGMISGKPGATAQELLTPSKVRELSERLSHNPFDALVVSLGGNDALGERLRRIFKDWVDGRAEKISAKAAFQRLLDQQVFERLVERYRLLLDTLAPLRRSRPDFRIVGHCYAPLLRIGQPADLTTANIGLIAIIKDEVGPWLWEPMRHVLADLAQGKVFADLLLRDGFCDRVMRPTREHLPGFFDFAEFSSVAHLLETDAWYDEIHPDPSGFAAMAPVLNEKIRAALNPSKRDAVGGQ